MFFSSNKNIDSIRELIGDLKKYLELQKQYVLLDLVSKMTVLLSALILGAILFMVGGIAILYISFTFAYFLSECLGSTTLGFGIVSILFIILIVVIHIMRKEWILKPLTNFLANLFLNGRKK